VLVLMLLGLARLGLEVLLGVKLTRKWYSFDADIIAVMSVFPVYLCFFLATVAHLLLRLFRVAAPMKRLVIFCFLLQTLHLVIPPLDALGFSLDLKWTLEPYLNPGCCSLSPFAHAPTLGDKLLVLSPALLLFTSPVLMTLGIVVAWPAVAIAFERHLAATTTARLWQRLVFILILFHVVYWPIYKYFFVFDWTVSLLLGWGRNHHWGYAAYFALMAVFGIGYCMRSLRRIANA
jgi:hypothetical protein